ncbi:MAG TPA: hypothetical protein VI912_02720 [Candidatus Bilamarchaeaceae archaeon]|nr:hypothetical protein [Candidatus Bilamarchaeaceae archaeon]
MSRLLCVRHGVGWRPKDPSIPMEAYAQRSRLRHRAPELELRMAEPVEASVSEKDRAVFLGPFGRPVEAETQQKTANIHSLKIRQIRRGMFRPVELIAITSEGQMGLLDAYRKFGLIGDQIAIELRDDQVRALGFGDNMKAREDTVRHFRGMTHLGELGETRYLLGGNRLRMIVYLETIHSEFKVNRKRYVVLSPREASVLAVEGADILTEITDRNSGKTELKDGLFGRTEDTKVKYYIGLNSDALLNFCFAPIKLPKIEFLTNGEKVTATELFVNAIKGETLELLVKGPAGCISQRAAERFSEYTDACEKRSFARQFPDPTSTILNIIDRLANGIAENGGKIDQQTLDNLLETGVLDITEYAMACSIIK